MNKAYEAIAGIGDLYIYICIHVRVFEVFIKFDRF